MEEKKKYLTEENYERSKKKIKRIAIIILVLGLLIGGSLIATGIIKSSRVETNLLNTSSKEELQAEIDSLNSELADLRTKQDQEFKSNGFSDEYYRLDNEIHIKETKVFALNTKIMKNDLGFNSSKEYITKAKYVPFYMFGIFIIIASCMFSSVIYFSTKQREIIAYQAQQFMPIAQEGIEKVVPTIGKANASIAKEMTPIYGDIAKEISKGIKEGLKDEEKK